MSGAIRVNVASVEASAALQVDSTTQGALFPRMTEAQRDAISSPATGLAIYNTDTDALNVYNGASWVAFSGASSTGDVSGPASSTDNGIARFDSTTGKLLQNSTSTIDDNGNLVLQQAAVINESGADVDTRIEGDTDANLIYVDAGTDRVGIGTATPNQKLHVSGIAELATLLLSTASELTIATGAVTVTQSFHTLDTEGDAASDDLDTINGGVAGRRLVVRADNTGRTVVLKHDTGNIQLFGAADVSLDETYKFVELIYDGALTKWVQIGGSGGGGGSGDDEKAKVSANDTTSGYLNGKLVAGTNITLTENSDGSDETLTISATSAPGGGAPPSICEGRLTLTSGTPVTTVDVTAATTLYFTPFRGSYIGLYNGTAWTIASFTELSLDISTFTADTNYDIFLDDDGTTLSGVAWTDATTRATDLATQNGIYVLSGDATKRYLGTIHITGVTGQCEDSAAKRFVWNYYNRFHRKFKVTDAANSWAYASAAWRAWNNSTANRVEFVIGVAEDMVSAAFHGAGVSATSGIFYGSVGIALDSTSQNDADVTASGVAPAAGRGTMLSASYRATIAAGYHYLQIVEYADGSTTFYGDGNEVYLNHGLVGDLAA